MANDNPYITEVNKKDLPTEIIGGKAVNLAIMTNAGFNIPPAAVVTVDAYDHFIKRSINQKILEILNKIDFNQSDSISKGCNQIRKTIVSSPLPEELLQQLNNKIKELPEGYYAVRSSAVAEDLPDASFAGQLDSFLNTKKEHILEKIIECWASYWNDRAVKYRHDSVIGHLDTDLTAAGIAVIVQKMVDAQVSGVTFTHNPVDGSSNLVIESTWGLGEAIVSGTVTPDIYILNRKGELLEEEIKNKNQGIFLKNGENTLLNIEKERRNQSSLNKDTLKKLSKLGLELENYFNIAQYSSP